MSRKTKQRDAVRAILADAERPLSVDEFAQGGVEASQGFGRGDGLPRGRGTC